MTGRFECVRERVAAAVGPARERDPDERTAVGAGPAESATVSRTKTRSGP